MAANAPSAPAPTAAASDARTRRQGSRIVDVDIHNTVPSHEALDPYLTQDWIRHRSVHGLRGYYGNAARDIYPKGNPQAARIDAWPPSGAPPGSDLPFMQEQHLDRLDVQYGILNPLYPAASQRNVEFGAALARAVNDWQVAEWLEKEPRLRASIVVPYEAPDLAAEEIRRVAGDGRFVQVLFLVRTSAPLGDRRYWPVFEAAQEHGLPIGMHFGGLGGIPITGVGWPSYYIEDHTGMAQAFQAQLVSLGYSGVFERFPDLQVILLEGGIAWAASLMWRLDATWRVLGSELPGLRKPPSAYLREHVWFSTQPIEEPPKREQFVQMLDHLGGTDRLLFATDYPHWDFDEPSRTFPVKLDAEASDAVFGGNARRLYGLEDG